MGKISGFFFVLIAALIMLIGAVGCGGGSSTPPPTPMPTPTSQIFPNDESLAQSPPIKVGTSGGNANDLGTKNCCIGTLGSLWMHVGTANPAVFRSKIVGVPARR